MKQSILLATTALVAFAAAAPLEKREYTSTVIEDVTQTVDVYTTVYVSPGDPRLTNQHLATQTPSSAPVASVTPLASTSAMPPPTPPQSTSQAPVIAPQQQKQALVVQAPAPTSTSVSSVAPPPVVPPKVEAPAPVVSVTPVAPVQPSIAPAPSQTPPSGSSSNTAPSGGSCGTVGGKCTAGDVTTFDGAGAAGACGYPDPEKTPDYVALAVGESPICSSAFHSKNPE